MELPDRDHRRLLSLVSNLRAVRSGRTSHLHPSTVMRLRFAVGGPTWSSPADVLALDRRRSRLEEILANTGVTASEAITAALVDRYVARALSRAIGRTTPKRDRPRCGARTRNGTPCQARATWDDVNDCPRTRRGRCRMHGGLSTGPRTAAGRQAAGGMTKSCGPEISSAA